MTARISRTTRPLPRTAASRPESSPPDQALGTTDTVAALDRARVSAGDPARARRGAATIVGADGRPVGQQVRATSARRRPPRPASAPPAAADPPNARAGAAASAAVPSAPFVARRRRAGRLRCVGRRRVGRRLVRRRHRRAATPRTGHTVASNSATEAYTGRPADAAIARAAGSAATIDRTRFRSRPSRASSRKLIRDVASREPPGSDDRDRRVGGRRGSGRPRS